MYGECTVKNRLFRRTLLLVPLAALWLAALSGTPTGAYADTVSTGQSSTTLSASVSSAGACTPTANGLHGLVLVSNGGAVATENLTISVHLTQPPSTTELSSAPVDVSVHPVLAPGENYSYPFTLSVPASGSYKVTATVTITNHSGSLGTPTGPSPSGDFTCGMPTAARVISFKAQWDATEVVLHWKTSSHLSIAGFWVYAAGHRLNSQLIQVHAGPKYTYRTLWSAGGPFTLVILLKNGTSITLTAR